VVEVSLTGEQEPGARRASSELAVHLRIYARRPDVRAVVHAHPPVATGFAVAGEGFTTGILPELVAQIGWVPLVPYATPGSGELAEQFEPFLASHDAFLMANHGATTVGPSLRIAHQRMESLEQSARILLVARLLGRVNALPPAAVDALLDLRRRAAEGKGRSGRR
jgi:L-fuculose-phosphate aldolase